MTPPTSSSHLQNMQEKILAMPMARSLNLSFCSCTPGAVELEMPVDEAFTFQPGQLQATPIFGIADFAAVSAAATLLPEGWINATVDATLKLLAPAKGLLLRSKGRVVHAGRLLTVCAADVYAVSHIGDETLCATLLGTARNIDLSKA